MAGEKKIKQRQTPNADELMDMAYQYIDHCINHTKEVVTSREVVKIKERHLPTIAYFLNIYVPMFSSIKQTLSRRAFYYIKDNENHPLFHTIKEIDELFRALATDIVANEGKGIFYAKNYLGMRNEPKDEPPIQHEIKFKFGNEE